jgi:hypothetical protein
MAGIRLEFAQFGHFDSFDVIRSITSMVGVADVDLPSPIATGLKTMYYVDSNVVKGQRYYYKVVVFRNGERFVSDEIRVLAGELWTPNHITTLMNFVADNAVVDGTNRVSKLIDSSGNNRDAVQGVNEKKPVLTTFGSLAQKALQFDGIDDFLWIADATYLQNKNEIWSFWVDQPTFRNAYISVFYAVYSGLLGSKLNISVNNGKPTVGGRRTIANSYAEVASTVNMASQVGLYFGQLDFTKKIASLFSYGLSVAVNNNFGTSGNADSQLLQGSVLGAYVTSTSGNGFSESYVGNIGCLVIGSGVLSIDDRQRLEGWAAHKYGLTSNLASDHPYKTTPPIL